MRRSERSLVGAVVALLMVGALAGCQKKTAGPTASDYQQKRAQLIAKRQQQSGANSYQPAPAQESPDSKSPGGMAMPRDADYAYDPVGKRDPFRSFVLERLREDKDQAKGPLEQFELAQLELLGVVWETKRARALVLDPSGQAYVVREGDPIGKNDGRVVGIGDNVMRVEETYVDYVGDKTTKEIEMHVRQSQGG